MTEMNLATRDQQSTPIIPRPTRYQVKLPIEVTHHAFVGTIRTQGVCTDVNEYGFGATVPQPLSVGEVVKVALELPTEKLNLLARVVYRSDFKYGFYFTDVAPEQRQAVSKALAFLQTAFEIRVQ